MRRREGAASDPSAIVHYAPWMSPPATLVMWFQLRSPELAEDFERLMAEDRDIVRLSLDTMSDWRLMRPADVPGQAIGQADYVLIAEIAEVERWEQQASEHVQRLEDDLEHLVRAGGCSSCVPSFEIRGLGGARGRDGGDDARVPLRTRSDYSFRMGGSQV